MKLCRFELLEDEGQLRTGIYSDGRVYETDGERGIGIHELSAVRFFPPLGRPPTLRFFDVVRDDQGEPSLTYTYGNPTLFVGPNGEIELPATLGSWDFEVRACAILGDAGMNVDRSEAPSFILGYTLMITIIPADMIPTPETPRDFGIAVGPFLITPEELEGTRAGEPTAFRWPFELLVNEDVIATGSYETLAFADLVALAAERHSVLPGEILAGPALIRKPLEITPLGRTILPTDRIQMRTDEMGILVVRLV